VSAGAHEDDNQWLLQFSSRAGVREGADVTPRSVPGQRPAYRWHGRRRAEVFRAWGRAAGARQAFQKVRRNRPASSRVGWVAGATRGQGLEEAGPFSEQGASVLVGDFLIEDGEYAAPALGTHSRV
jgi:hypothetical protein